MTIKSLFAHFKRRLPFAHDFTKWHLASETGRTVQRRQCSDCGFAEQSELRNGHEIRCDSPKDHSAPPPPPWNGLEKHP